MKTQHRNTENKGFSKADFFKVALKDKLAMREYIKKNGTLEGFKSTHFVFTKPL